MSRIFAVFVLQREVFKHFDEDSRPREDKIIHNKVAKAAKTNHLSQLSRDALSSCPLCPCCEISDQMQGIWILVIRTHRCEPHLPVKMWLIRRNLNRHLMNVDR